MEQEQVVTRGFKRKPTKAQIIKGSIASVLYILWVIWVGNPFLLILLPIIIDIYSNKFIPWTFWK